jgi:hypothetical protein
MPEYGVDCLICGNLWSEDYFGQAMDVLAWMETAGVQANVRMPSLYQLPLYK